MDKVSPTTDLRDNQHPGYPDKLDARLFRIAGVCILTALMAILDTTFVAVAQRTLIDQFGSTQAVAAWTMTGYTLAVATVIPITGWAADRFGTKRLFMISVLAFTLGSLLCALAPTMPLLIAFRVLQGFGSGMLQPLGIMILTREAGPRRLGRLLAVLGVPMMVGPIGAPILGGWLIGAYGWKSIFLINLPIGLAAFVLAAVVFPRDRPALSETFDFVGMLLLSPGLAIFLFGASSIPGYGGVSDPHVWAPATIGVALIIAFVVHALHRAVHPLIDLRLFQNRVVTNANVTMLVFSVAFFGTGLLFPGYLQQVLHQTPLQSGLLMMPQGLGAMLTMPFAGYFIDRHGPGRSVLLGVTLITAGLAIFTFGVATQAHYSPTLLGGLAIMGLGMGCTMMPLATAAMQALAPHQIARGTTLMAVNQQVGRSIGAALMSVILTGQFNASENITAANQLTILQHKAAGRGVPINPSTLPQQSMSHAFTANLLHDLSHAYAVVFAIAAVLVALTLIPAYFLPKRPTLHTAAPLD
jgi:EmrB/QacA subfamily drug resistance transporter